MAFSIASNPAPWRCAVADPKSDPAAPRPCKIKRVTA
jgi:hypothetical protein